MSTQEKLLRSFDLLKKMGEINPAETNIHKKDKIRNCKSITECLCFPSTQLAPNYSKLLTHSMEVFLELCDDPDSDIRMVAEESLNRTIRALNDENISKVLIELHKEMKRNGPARSVKAALIRFSKLVHFIRPHKGKSYVLYLFPTLMKLIERTEESIHETLAVSLPRIIEILGPFTTDIDIKKLLKKCISNISNSSAVIKRTTASCIHSICLHCCKPYLSTVFCIHITLGFMFPLNENCDSHQILGVFAVLKLLLPHWKTMSMERNRFESEKKENELNDLQIDKLQQVYELCLYYINHEDHNIVNYSLETLTILLQNSTRNLTELLLSNKGISEIKTQGLSSEPELPNEFLSSDPLTDAESELTESIRPDIKKWMDESKLAAIDDSFSVPSTFIEQSELNRDMDSSLEISFAELNIEGSSQETEFTVSHNNYKDIEDNFLTESLKKEQPKEFLTKNVCVGHLYDQDIPLKYCTRLLCKSFLLTGLPGFLMPDEVCRVSVKSSALICLSEILKLYPNIFIQYLDKSITMPDQNVDQMITDVILYSDHADPQLRGNIRILVSNLILSLVCQTKYGDGARFFRNSFSSSFTFDFGKFISVLITGLTDESSLCIRLTLQGLTICLNHMLESKHSKEAIPLLYSLPTLMENSYWLVKVNLCELLSSLSFSTVYYVTGNNKFQMMVLNDILLKLIEDTDIRVRKASSSSLASSIQKFHFGEKSIISWTKLYRKQLLSNICSEQNSISLNWKKVIDEMPFPLNKMAEIPEEDTEKSLSKVIDKLYRTILASNRKFKIVGGIKTLSYLSQAYPCTVYKVAWGCTEKKRNHVDHTIDLLQLCIDFIEGSALMYEIDFHVDLLILLSNLYAGYSCFNMKIASEEEIFEKWSMFEASSHRKISDIFLKHIIRLLGIFQNIIDNHIHQSHSKNLILSLPTTLSPIKRKKNDLGNRSMNPSKKQEEKDDKEKSFSEYVSHIHYLRISEGLETAYCNYKHYRRWNGCFQCTESLKLEGN